MSAPRTVINGKRYDTGKAIRIGHYEHSYRNQFDWYHEELYQKKRTGEFFIHGAGNAASKYAKRHGYNETGPGERFVPLSDTEAREWLEAYRPDLVETYFEVEDGDADSDEPVIRFSAQVTVGEKIYWTKAAGGIVRNQDGQEVGAGLVPGARPPLLTRTGDPRELLALVKSELAGKPVEPVGTFTEPAPYRVSATGKIKLNGRDVRMVEVYRLTDGTYRHAGVVPVPASTPKGKLLETAVELLGRDES